MLNEKSVNALVIRTHPLGTMTVQRFLSMHPKVAEILQPEPTGRQNHAASMATTKFYFIVDLIVKYVYVHLRAQCIHYRETAF